MVSLPLARPQSLVRDPLSRRRQLLRENFVETEGEFVFATSLDTKDMDQIAEFLEQSVKGEGPAPLPTAVGSRPAIRCDPRPPWTVRPESCLPRPL